MPRNFKELPSMGKILGTVFWDYQRVIMIEYGLKSRTVTADTYFDALMRLGTLHVTS